MLTNTRNWIMAGMLGMLVACGGGGGGNSAPGVQPGPPPPGQPVPPEPIPPAPAVNPYVDATALNAFITSATLNGDNQPVIHFTLSDGNNVAITDLTSNDVRFVVSKLQTSPLGSFTGTWQSYTSAVATPQYGPGTEPKLQASYERDDGNHPFGEFNNNGGGNYSYRYATNLDELPQDVLDQAAAEGLDLSFDPNLTHRVAIQFDNNNNRDKGGWANPSFDWVPQTGAVPPNIPTMDIAATANCNNCHDPLAIHGGTRREIKYCVTCHNPGSVDPDSGNTVDMKVMIHKIHMGANLPSVQAGEPYFIVGFRGSVHDYSTLHYPQDIRNCVNCHAGSSTGAGLEPFLTLTDQGDNWAEVVTQAACGSCHDDVDFSEHQGGQPDDSNCSSCHAPGKKYGTENAHRNLVTEAGEAFAAEIQAVTNTGPGEFPQVQYRVFDPTNGNAPYDLLNDPVWTSTSDGASRLAIDLAWDTTDYTNTGNDEVFASAVSLNALEGTPIGGGSYIITSDVAIPDGSQAPGIAATGSGVAGIEGHPAVNIGSDEEPNVQRVPFTNVKAFFSIDEVDGEADPRRDVVAINQCLSCHSQLSLHGSNRTDEPQVCVACHNPRNTDRQKREITTSPPTDGKDEESLDFKTLIHAIHAAGMRENTLEVYGFRGSKHIYGPDEVHFPGNLANCTTCHDGDSYALPLAPEVLATTNDTGADHESPVDDIVTTPTTAVCSSCHDDSVAAAHMTSNGGSFATTQAAIDSGEVIEECSVCHATGRNADVAEVHGLD
jgi:OmcA/MtrC family decaheme c-type cytochrome